MGREILITPNRNTTGSTLEPTISFSGATNGSINLKVEDDGSIVFEGTNGGLFNITDSKNGLLHSVNDVSGLPILSVYSDDRVIAGAYNQNALVVNSDKVGIGEANPLTRLHVSGDTVLGSQAVFISDVRPTQSQIDNFLNNGNKGLTLRYSHTGDTIISSFNANSSGRTGVVLGRTSGNKNFSIQNNGDDYIRIATTPVNGFDFYKNKVVFQAGTNLDGIVFNLDLSGNNGKLWFEQNANSPMVIMGGGAADDLRLGIALNPDGTEMPTSNLQVGGTGTTGTFKYRDGNQQSGYVLTSDSDGNATWQVSTGGGSGTTIVQFTGNTSASCITDLWVTNVHGCSPITFWDQLQHSGSTASGLFSTAFGYQTKAIGDYSHAEGGYPGFETIASGISSHAEGIWTFAIGQGSHAEGGQTLAMGDYSHVENVENQAIGDYSHAEGQFTQALGLRSHAEGYNSIANGDTSHAEGHYTVASGDGSHAGGYGWSNTRRVIASQRGSFNHSVVDSSYSGTGSSNLGTFILGGFNNSVSMEWSGVIGGAYNDLRGGGIPVPMYSVIVGGTNNVIYTGYRSVVLGGTGITGTSNDTVYVPDFVIKKAAAVPTSASDPIGEIGSITYDDDYLYIKTPRSGGRWGRVLLDTSW